VEWYGFAPKKHRSPAGTGKVDRADRSEFINHFITFDIGDIDLRNAVDEVVEKYSRRTYVLGVCDCVSFTADVARKAGLSVPALNFTPYGFLKILGVWNSAKASG
jgi:hypothetical protein